MSYYQKNREEILRKAAVRRSKQDKLKVRLEKQEYYLKNRERFLKDRKSPKSRWLYTKRIDQERGHQTCALEYFESVVVLPCKYCGFQPSVGCNGADRIDNEFGHVAGNIVSACWPCNRARGNLFSYEEMIKFIGPAIKQTRLDREKNHVSCT